MSIKLSKTSLSGDFFRAQNTVSWILFKSESLGPHPCQKFGCPLRTILIPCWFMSVRIDRKNVVVNQINVFMQNRTWILNIFWISVFQIQIFGTAHVVFPWTMISKNNMASEIYIWLEYFREVLNLAHVCRDWRSLVFKYDLLEEFMERFDEDEDYISDWIFFRCIAQFSAYGLGEFECISTFSNLI